MDKEPGYYHRHGPVGVFHALGIDKDIYTIQIDVIFLAIVDCHIPELVVRSLSHIRLYILFNEAFCVRMYQEGTCAGERQINA